MSIRDDPKRTALGKKRTSTALGKKGQQTNRQTKRQHHCIKPLHLRAGS